MMNNRILSIDIFRGLTIFMMVFVNDLAGISDIPTWMKHIPPGQNGMTFVDVVFPAFLFIVGMAIPFAMKQRRLKSDNPFELWKHVFTRTLGLLILGFYMVNSEEMNAEANLIPKGLWDALFYLSAIFIWNNYSKGSWLDKGKQSNALQIIGLLVLVALFFLFRKGTAEQPLGMTLSWWGILGLIGWAYLFSVIIYQIAGRNIFLFSGAFGITLFLLLYIRANEGFIPDVIEWFMLPGHLSHTLITLAGVICSLILMQHQVQTNFTTKMIQILLWGGMLAILGYFTRFSGGISKIGATPSWALYSSAICCVIFPFVYWLVDIRGFKNWADFLKPAGENPLLTYILPSLFAAVVGLSWLPSIFHSGALGFIRSVLFSLFILLIAKWLTKEGVRLKL